MAVSSFPDGLVQNVGISWDYMVSRNRSCCGAKGCFACGRRYFASPDATYFCPWRQLENGLRRPTFPSSWKSGQKSRKKPKVSSLPCALYCAGIRRIVPHVHANLPVSFRQRTVSATAPLPLAGSTNNAFGSTVAVHERQRRKRDVSSSYGATWNLFCKRVVHGIKIRKV